VQWPAAERNTVGAIRISPGQGGHPHDIDHDQATRAGHGDAGGAARRRAHGSDGAARLQPDRPEQSGEERPGHQHAALSDAADGDTLPEPTVIRDVRRVNGRTPRERDKKDRTGCTDPNPLSPEPLAFLLPAHRSDYRFTAIHEGREKDRAALVIDFMTSNRKSKPQLIEDERGHDDEAQHGEAVLQKPLPRVGDERAAGAARGRRSSGRLPRRRIRAWSAGRATSGTGRIG